MFFPILLSSSHHLIVSMSAAMHRCHWTSFPSTLQRTASSLLASSEMSDVSLVAGERIIPCHKIILGAASGWFRTLFRQLGGQERTVIVLKDVDPGHLVSLIEFIYTGEVSVPQSELRALLVAAQGMGISEFEQSCDSNKTIQLETHFENKQKRNRLETSRQKPSKSFKVGSEHTSNDIEQALANVKTEITEEDSQVSFYNNQPPLLQTHNYQPDPGPQGPLLFPDPQSFCSRCKDVFDKRANPIPCINCNLWFHLKCRGGHSCGSQY